MYAPRPPRFGMVPEAIQPASACLICPSDIFAAGAVLMLMKGLTFPIPTLYCDSPPEYVLSDSMSLTAFSTLATQADAEELAKYGPQ